MKKIILIMILTTLVISIKAQLVVNEDGKVGIGTESPQALLQINKSSATDLGDVRGIKVYSNNSFGKNIGIESRAVSSSSFTCAIQGGVDSTFAAPSAGVLGYASWGKGAGIFGTTHMGTYTNYNDTTLFPLTGLWAGFFHGNVRIVGSSSSNAYLTSLGNTTNNMTPISDIISILKGESQERVSDKLGQVQAVQFLRYGPLKNDEDSKTETMQNEENPNEEKLSAIQYGLNPEQLKKVYPELVYEDEDGNISINYVEMVPLLVQSINELSQELAELKGASSKKSKAKARTETASIEETASGVDMVRMDQNKPNPFSESTVITLNIPKNTQKASIFIYDMSGKQVQAIPVSERGETNITVYASDLSAGMYIYTLVMDGKAAVTRKMIVSEA